MNCLHLSWHKRLIQITDIKILYFDVLTESLEIIEALRRETEDFWRLNVMEVPLHFRL